MSDDTADIPPRALASIFHRERIEYWSLVAEIVAALAIVVSLVFVGVQLSQANAIAERDEANATMEQWSQIRRSLYDNAGASEIFATGMTDPASLDDAERLRFRFMVREYAWATWHIWDRIDRGLIPGTHWQEGAGRDLLQVICTPGGALFWRDVRRELPPGFPEAVDELVPGFRGSQGEPCDPSQAGTETLTPPRTDPPIAR